MNGLVEVEDHVASTVPAPSYVRIISAMLALWLVHGRTGHL